MIVRPAVVLVRHASTDWSGVRYCGRSDPPLNAAGWAEAVVLASELAPTLSAGTRLVTSPLQRARGTAEAIAAAANIADIVFDDRWREVDCGTVEGLTFDEVARIAPGLARQLTDGDSEIDWPDGERAADLAARVAAAWCEVIDSGTETVVVSHAGALRIAIALARGVPPRTVDLPGTASAFRLQR
ncbi:MAG: histidine phosphatase family protein [Chloroflexota bacterium]